MRRLGHYQKISPTARLVAAMRRYSEIPYAEEIAQALGTDEFQRELTGGEPLASEVVQTMAPMIEARYLSMMEAIRLSGVTQVLELAAGFTFRGAVMLAEHDLHYVETDLPDMHRERSELRRALEAERKLPPNKNLIFAPANLMSTADMDRVTREFDPARPLAIVHEGLFQYFSMEEKRKGALAIRRILERFGGVWMTPDFEPRSLQGARKWTHPQFAQIYGYISKISARDLGANAFETNEQVLSFFKDVGFDVTTVPQIDGSYRLTSPRRVGSTPERLEALRDTLALRVMRVTRSTRSRR